MWKWKEWICSSHHHINYYEDVKKHKPHFESLELASGIPLGFQHGYIVEDPDIQVDTDSIDHKGDLILQEMVEFRIEVNEDVDTFENEHRLPENFEEQSSQEDTLVTHFISWVESNEVDQIQTEWAETTDQNEEVLEVYERVDPTDRVLDGELFVRTETGALMTWASELEAAHYLVSVIRTERRIKTEELSLT